MSYFAVCYGHACRYEKASSQDEAARLAFGVKFDGRMSIRQMPKSPKSMSHKAKMEVLAVLSVDHFKRTGNILQGWEKQPGIAGIHRNECPKCHAVSLVNLDKGSATAVTEDYCDKCSREWNERQDASQDERGKAISDGLV